METIKRYGLKMGDLSRDAALKGVVSAGRGVPKQFLETPGRLWLKRMIRVMGLFCFVITVLAVAGCFIIMLFPASMNQAFAEATMGMIAGLFFINHMGLFIEMGADTTGKNWFAKAAGIMWVSFLGTFVIGLLVEIVKSVF